jgi:hypothetical protein
MHRGKGSGRLEKGERRPSQKIEHLCVRQLTAYMQKYSSTRTAAPCRCRVRVTTPFVALLVQRRAANRAAVVIVREPRDAHARVHTPARRERVRIRASALAQRWDR